MANRVGPAKFKHPNLIRRSINSPPSFLYSTQRPLISAEIGPFTSRTTGASGASSSSGQPQTSKTDDDIPDWKRAMLERQAARNRESAAYSTSSTSSTGASDQYPSDPRNFGFIPGLKLKFFTDFFISKLHNTLSIIL